MHQKLPRYLLAFAVLLLLAATLAFLVAYALVGPAALPPFLR